MKQTLSPLLMCSFLATLSLGMWIPGEYRVLITAITVALVIFGVVIALIAAAMELQERRFETYQNTISKLTNNIEDAQIVQ